MTATLNQPNYIILVKTHVNVNNIRSKRKNRLLCIQQTMLRSKSTMDSSLAQPLWHGLFAIFFKSL